MNKFVRHIYGLVLLLFIGVSVHGQQNHSLFFMHYLPESNLVNPAVPITCKWYIGIPVLSSVHLNYGNSSFSFKNLYNDSGEGNYSADPDKLIKGMRRRNYIGTEVHAQLFALGHRRADYSFMFTITEKDNTPLTYPKEVFELALNGNTQFEGEEVGFKGTGLYFQHYREFALSVSKTNKDGIYYGVRAKVLFGKLNTASRSTDVNLYTDETTFNLAFNGDLKVHSSLPIVVETDNGTVTNVSYDESASITGLLFNRKNPGFAIDAGIIYPYSDKLELSASVLDLGFIRWRSNLNTFNGSGDFEYEGPMGDSLYEGDYFDGVWQSFLDSMEVTAAPQKYTTLMTPRVIAGGNYSVTDKLKTGFQGQVLFYKSKVLPSFTLSANYNIFRYTYLMASYTVQYNTFRNFGLGFVVGRSPLQFYMISDNVAGFIWPMSTRNLNLRFGLNINLGCNIRTKDEPRKGSLRGNCYYLEQDIKRNYKKQNNKKK